MCETQLYICTSLVKFFSEGQNRTLIELSGDVANAISHIAFFGKSELTRNKVRVCGKIVSSGGCRFLKRSHTLCAHYFQSQQFNTDNKAISSSKSLL